MLLDHFTMGFIIAIPLILLSFLINSDDPFEISTAEHITFYLMTLIYLNKDFLRGKSFAKRKLGLQLINRRTGKSANELQCFIRNITVLVWPLEVMVIMVSPKRRIGDLLANTKVELGEKEDVSSIFADLKQFKLTSTTIWTLGLGLIYIGIFWYVIEQGVLWPLL